MMRTKIHLSSMLLLSACGGSAYARDGFAEKLRGGCNELTCEKLALEARDRAARCAAEEDDDPKACNQVQRELGQAEALLSRSELVVGRDEAAEKRAAEMQAAHDKQQREQKAEAAERAVRQKKADALPATGK